MRLLTGLINQLRQEDLGIERYIWRSQDDAKVRDSRAAYDDRVFRWDNPPEDGHPGEAHNCRCYAEPVLPGVQSNVVLADFAPTAGVVPALDPTDAIHGLRALTSIGAALLASDALQAWTEAMRDRRVDAAGARLGVDVTTVEGRLAATAYALVQEGISSGGYPVLPKNPEFARIGAEAAALYELLNPGTILDTGAGGSPAKQRALQDFIEAVGEAYARGDLRLQEGELAQGWVEVFPELSEGERRLGQLPGCTPERIEQWLETYPIEDLGLPNNTGSPIPGDPTDSIISTPIPEEAGPNIVAVQPGEPTPINPSDDEATQRGHRRENEAAQILGQNGFDIIQNPLVDGLKRPDYLINGEVYDHYAPSTDHPRRIWERVQEKVEKGQAANIVIGLQDSSVDEDALRQQFENWPIEGLGDVIIIRPDGTIGRL
ncbi:phage minor head protein [Actibacterium sp. XHP0104]|uniref:CdiA C-terminal domain-containing protein n=1 Tax=Actibacterium sp. XHP0104 TaxID=2984335 RepID=UPI0021E81692|nr:phage minor head protein [Actibacterium sp. XHP0104]MCV2883066.1 phage minor head protein [Actibacterium sp. XHP0104]